LREEALVTARVTPLGLSIMAVAGCALSLAVLSGRPELFVAALPLLLALVPLALRAPALDHRISHEVSRERVFEGERVTVAVTVTARAPIPLIELLGPLPAGGAVVSGRHRAVMTVGAGGTAQWSYEIVFPGRGVHVLGAVTVRRRDRSGVRCWEHRHIDP
jgi:uncharacterized protein (DUF58 family)